jgi:hypothetical protein
VKYELGSYIPEDDILHSQRRDAMAVTSVMASRFTLTEHGVRILPLAFLSGNRISLWALRNVLNVCQSVVGACSP